jgi:hypothetical protein
VHPAYHTSPKPVKQARCSIPAVRHEPHPGYPGSVATYVTSDGRLLPIWDQEWLDATLENIAFWRGQAAA